ncbi:MAG: CHAP domain-containing protein [Candidatus Dormibacteria bacterium]
MVIRGLRLRLLRHAWVLLIALLLPVVGPRLPGAAAVSTVPSTQILNAVIEGTPSTATAPTGAAMTVMAPTGATVATLAATYGRNAAAITWANDYVFGTEPTAGSPVLLPPGPGALVKVGAGELPSEFADGLGLDPSELLDYNVIQADVPLAAGTYLQVPLASAPPGALNAAAFVPEAPGVPEVPPSKGGDGFPYGYCTYYVATLREVSWDGNANQWWANARPYRPEGRVPVAGAIVVFDYAPDGHVGFVESVDPDGSFVISEMNYGWWAHVDQRTISPTDPTLVGFIY